MTAVPQIESKELEALEAWEEVQEERYEQEEDYAPESMPVDDRHQANLILRRIRQLRAVRAEVEESFDREIARIEAELLEVKRRKVIATSTYERREAWHTAILYRWGQEVIKADPRTKTIRLPQGDISFRQPPDKFEYDDERLIPFLLENRPDLIRQKPEVDRVALKSAIASGPNHPGLASVVDRNGALVAVQGVMILPQPMTMKITTI